MRSNDSPLVKSVKNRRVNQGLIAKKLLHVVNIMLVNRFCLSQEWVAMMGYRYTKSLMLIFSQLPIRTSSYPEVHGIAESYASMDKKLARHLRVSIRPFLMFNSINFVDSCRLFLVNVYVYVYVCANNTAFSSILADWSQPCSQPAHWLTCLQLHHHLHIPMF